MAEDSYIDVARQRRTVNKLKELIDKKADADSIASDVFIINLDAKNMTADKTYQEILNAYNANKYLLLNIRNRRSENPVLFEAFRNNVFFFIECPSTYKAADPTSTMGPFLDAVNLIWSVSDQNKWFKANSFMTVERWSKDDFDRKEKEITLKDSAITTAKLADGSVTKAKLGSDIVIPENAAEVFTITVSDMTSEGTWNHDKTWEEINTAYLAGKILRVKYTEGDEQYLDWCSYSNSCFYFANYDPQENSNILIKILPDDTAYVTRPSSLPAATASTLGGVKVGDGLSVTDDGTLSANASQAVIISPTSDTLTTDEKTKIVDNWPNVVLYYNNIYYYPSRLVAPSYYYFSNFTISSIRQSGANDIVHLPKTKEVYVSSNKLITIDGSVSTASRLGYGVVKLSDEFDIKNGKLVIANTQIDTDKLASNAVTADKIADGAITADKLASGVGGGATIGSIAKMDWATPLSVISIPVGDYIMYLITFMTTEDNVQKDIKAYRTSDYSSVLDTAPGGGLPSHTIFCRKNCVYTLPWFDYNPNSVSA